MGLLLVVGCTAGPAAPETPEYDPAAFAEGLIERADKDSSGGLSRQEAEGAAPGIAAGWARYDRDGDGNVSREELAARVQEWLDDGSGLASIFCVVRLNGQPVGDVTVKMVPDDALGGVVKAAEAVSAADRPCSFNIPEDQKPAELRGLSGLQYGLYTVEVSHPTLQLKPAAGSRGRDIGRPDQSGPVTIDVERG